MFRGDSKQLRLEEEHLQRLVGPAGRQGTHNRFASASIGMALVRLIADQYQHNPEEILRSLEIKDQETPQEKEKRKKLTELINAKLQNCLAEIKKAAHDYKAKDEKLFAAWQAGINKVEQEVKVESEFDNASLYFPKLGRINCSFPLGLVVVLGWHAIQDKDKFFIPETEKVLQAEQQLKEAKTADEKRAADRALFQAKEAVQLAKNDDKRMAREKEDRVREFLNALWRNANNPVCHHGIRNDVISLLNHTYVGFDLIEDAENTIVERLRSYLNKRITELSKTPVGIKLLFDWMTTGNASEVFFHVSEVGDAKREQNKLSENNTFLKEILNLFLQNGTNLQDERLLLADDRQYSVTEAITIFLKNLPFDCDPKALPVFHQFSEIFKWVELDEGPRAVALKKFQDELRKNPAFDDPVVQKRIDFFVLLYKFNLNFTKNRQLLYLSGKMGDFDKLFLKSNEYLQKFEKEQFPKAEIEEFRQSESALMDAIRLASKDTMQDYIGTFLGKWYASLPDVKEVIAFQATEADRKIIAMFRKQYADFLSEEFQKRVVLDCKSMATLFEESKETPGTVSLTPYAINRFFLHALIVPFEKWDETYIEVKKSGNQDAKAARLAHREYYADYLKRLINFVGNNFDEKRSGQGSELHLVCSEELRKTSYPYSLLEQLTVHYNKYVEKCRDPVDEKNAEIMRYFRSLNAGGESLDNYRLIMPPHYCYHRHDWQNILGWMDEKTRDRNLNLYLNVIFNFFFKKNKEGKPLPIADYLFHAAQEFLFSIPPQFKIRFLQLLCAEGFLQDFMQKGAQDPIDMLPPEFKSQGVLAIPKALLFSLFIKDSASLKKITDIYPAYLSLNFIKELIQYKLKTKEMFRVNKTEMVPLLQRLKVNEAIEILRGLNQARTLDNGMIDNLLYTTNGLIENSSDNAFVKFKEELIRSIDRSYLKERENVKIIQGVVSWGFLGDFLSYTDIPSSYDEKDKKSDSAISNTPQLDALEFFLKNPETLQRDLSGFFLQSPTTRTLPTGDFGLFLSSYKSKHAEHYLFFLRNLAKVCGSLDEMIVNYFVLFGSSITERAHWDCLRVNTSPRLFNLIQSPTFKNLLEVLQNSSALYRHKDFIEKVVSVIFAQQKEIVFDAYFIKVYKLTLMHCSEEKREAILAQLFDKLTAESLRVLVQLLRSDQNDEKLQQAVPVAKVKEEIFTGLAKTPKFRNKLRKMKFSDVLEEVLSFQDDQLVNDFLKKVEPIDVLTKLFEEIPYKKPEFILNLLVHIKQSDLLINIFPERLVLLQVLERLPSSQKESFMNSLAEDFLLKMFGVKIDLLESDVDWHPDENKVRAFLPEEKIETIREGVIKIGDRFKAFENYVSHLSSEQRLLFLKKLNSEFYQNYAAFFKFVRDFESRDRHLVEEMGDKFKFYNVWCVALENLDKDQDRFDFIDHVGVDDEMYHAAFLFDKKNQWIFLERVNTPLFYVCYTLKDAVNYQDKNNLYPVFINFYDTLQKEIKTYKDSRKDRIATYHRDHSIDDLNGALSIIMKTQGKILERFNAIIKALDHEINRVEKHHKKESVLARVGVTSSHLVTAYKKALAILEPYRNVDPEKRMAVLRGALDDKAMPRPIPKAPDQKSKPHGAAQTLFGGVGARDEKHRSKDPHPKLEPPDIK